MVFDQQKADLFLHNFTEAYRAAKRLQTSINRLRAFLPSKDTNIMNSAKKSEQLDAFRVRFTDLQDCLGNKVFRSLLALEEEKAESMLDVLNKMEKRRIIISFSMWKLLRDLRNGFSHDYPESENERLEALNQAFVKAKELIKIVNTLSKYAKKLGLDMTQYVRI